MRIREDAGSVNARGGEGRGETGGRGCMVLAPVSEITLCSMSVLNSIYKLVISISTVEVEAVCEKQGEGEEEKGEEGEGRGGGRDRG